MKNTLQTAKSWGHGDLNPDLSHIVCCFFTNYCSPQGITSQPIIESLGWLSNSAAILGETEIVQTVSFSASFCMGAHYSLAASPYSPEQDNSPLDDDEEGFA